MKRVCTRACIGTFYGISSHNKTKQTFQIHARDKVEFLRVVGGVAIGKINRNSETWLFSVSKDTANNNFGRYEN